MQLPVGADTKTESRPRKLRFARALTHQLRGLYVLYARHTGLALRYVRRIPALEDAEKFVHDARNARIVAVISDEGKTTRSCPKSAT